MRKIVWTLLLVASAYIVTRGKPATDVVTLTLPATDLREPPPARSVAVSPQQAPPRTSYECDGRTHCSQMRSCGEAKYFLAHCPNTKMDGDGDGVPCEDQWCG